MVVLAGFLYLIFGLLVPGVARTDRNDAASTGMWFAVVAVVVSLATVSGTRLRRGHWLWANLALTALLSLSSTMGTVFALAQVLNKNASIRFALFAVYLGGFSIYCIVTMCVVCVTTIHYGRVRR